MSDVFETVASILALEPAQVRLTIDESDGQAFALVITSEGKRHRINFCRHQLHIYEAVLRGKNIPTNLSLSL